MSSLMISKDSIKMPCRFNSDENVAKEVGSIFPGNFPISMIIAEYAVDLETCSICLRDIAYPVILECGHLFDLDCISNWAKNKNSCPLCRKNISKIQYAEGVIKKVSAVFSFKFLSNTQIDPITINVYSSVQRIKTLVSYGAFRGIDNLQDRSLITAAFCPNARNMARDLLIASIYESGERVANGVYSDTMLSDYKGIKPGGVYEVFFRHKFAQYGLPCDRCYSNPELEQTCDHPDEKEDPAGI